MLNNYLRGASFFLEEESHRTRVEMILTKDPLSAIKKDSQLNSFIFVKCDLSQNFGYS